MMTSMQQQRNFSKNDLAQTVEKIMKKKQVLR